MFDQVDLQWSNTIENDFGKRLLITYYLCSRSNDSVEGTMINCQLNRFEKKPELLITVLNLLLIN